MTNLEAIQNMSADQLAALLYTGRTNLPGWAYPELIDWLNAPDNISDKVNDDLIAYCWRNLLTSDCEERLRKEIPKESDKVIKAMHMICGALTRPPKTGQPSTINADRQERYYAIASKLTDVITEEAGHDV